MSEITEITATLYNVTALLDKAGEGFENAATALYEAFGADDPKSHPAMDLEEYMEQLGDILDSLRATIRDIERLGEE